MDTPIAGFWILLLWVRNFVLNAFFFVPVAYVQGLWFLFAHPLNFMAFVKEWKRFQYRIADNDSKNQDLLDGGYFSFNRRQRRRLDRKIK